MVHEASVTTQPIVFDPEFLTRRAAAVDPLLTEMATGELRPYDPTFVGERIGQSYSNRVLRQQPELRQAIRDTLVATDDESILVTASALIAAHETAKPANVRPVADTLSFLTLVNEMMREKEEATPDTPHDRVNALANLAGRDFVQHIPLDQVPRYAVSIQYLSFVLNKIRETAPNGHSVDNVMTKLITMRGLMNMRYHAAQYAEAIPASDERQYSREEIDHDSQQIQELFGQIRATQQYGIKLGYHPSRLGGSLIYSPPNYTGRQRDGSIHPNVHPIMTESSTIVEVIHSQKEHFRRIKPSVEDGVHKSLFLDYNDLEPVANIYVGPSGELYTDPFCTTSFLEIFAAQNKYGAYRKLQAEILSDYFDATHSVETVHAIRQQASTTEPDRHGTEEPMETIGRLLIPRARCTYETSPAPDADSEPGESDDTSHAHRELRFHGVVWHRRQLPEGWKASPQAVELATELGITLRQGETFVKAHNRGSKKLGEVVGHMLIDRPEEASDDTV